MNEERFQTQQRRAVEEYLDMKEGSLAKELHWKDGCTIEYGNRGFAMFKFRNGWQVMAMYDLTTGCTAAESKQYYYRPIAYFSGRVLKCAGYGAEKPKHRAFYEPWFNACQQYNGEADTHYLPGVVIVDGYRGDRISADTLMEI